MRARAVFLFLISSLAFSCSENASEIGIDFFEEGELEVVYVDTLTLRASTVLVDSLVTSAPTRLIAGYHEDSDLGTVTVKSYLQVVPPTNRELSDQVRYSRTTLLLNYDKYSYYDTTNNTTLFIHQMTEALEYTELYTNTSFDYNPTPIGQLTFAPRPNRTETALEIPISDALGSELFELTRTSSNTITNRETFMTYFKGLVIVPSTNVSGPMLGFSTTLTLKVYYFDESVTPIEEKSIDFNLGDGLRTIETDIDRSGTDLSGLNAENNAIRSELTNNRVYMQAMYGLRTRVEIPYLKDLLLDNSKILLSDAILELTPVKGSYESNTTLPAFSSAFIYSPNSELYSAFESARANLVEDFELGRNTKYRADVSDFVREQLNFTSISNNSLVFNISEATLGTTLNRIYLNGTTGSDRLKLSLRYVVLKD